MTSFLPRPRSPSPWRAQINRRGRGRSRTFMSLDSPRVSVTQIIPPWPKPRDKSDEVSEPDPSPVPSPPPTPIPEPPPEGAEEEEEEDEELDEEQLAALAAEELRRKKEEEEARWKADNPPLPPPIPPPPQPPPSPIRPRSPQLAPLPRTDSDRTMKMLMSTASIPTNLIPDPGTEEDILKENLMNQRDQDGWKKKTRRKIVLLQDAVKGYILKKAARKAAKENAKKEAAAAAEKEAFKPEDLPTDFLTLPDKSAVLRGSTAVQEKEAAQHLPFTSLMAIMISYKYIINTWTKSIVDFVVSSGVKMLEMLRKQDLRTSSYILPTVTVGHDKYKPAVRVMFDGPTWRLEEILQRYLLQYDRGIFTTYYYSCAFFEHDGFYYLFDGSTCNALGVRIEGEISSSGKACFIRFPDLHSLVCRILFNKDGDREDQQFVLTNLTVTVIPTGVRYELPDDYVFNTDQTLVAKNLKSKMTIYKDRRKTEDGSGEIIGDKGHLGYHKYGGMYRILGSTALSTGHKGVATPHCHFVCVVAMLLATMRPLKLWNAALVDICIEKGLEMYYKVKNHSVCENRVVKNLCLCGKIVNLKIKLIPVINETEERNWEHEVKEIFAFMRYVIIMFPNKKNLVLCHSKGAYHVFDCYPPPFEAPESFPIEQFKQSQTNHQKFASWTRYSTMDSLISRLEKHADGPDDVVDFFTFEVKLIKNVSRQQMLMYKLTNAFMAAGNPNQTPKRKEDKYILDEKLYWLNDEDRVLWAPDFLMNPLGLQRGTPETLWYDWNIEFPGDLFTLWGTVHPTDSRFSEKHRGKQYLACCIVALVLIRTCKLSVWTRNVLDGIVIAGNQYHETLTNKLKNKINYEMTCTDFDGLTGQYGLYSFTPISKLIIFGFVYNILRDRFNLSRALQFFFENESVGILVSNMKNLAFGKVDGSYFMFDCQTTGFPVFSFGSQVAYALKCETLNMLVYCMTMTLNPRKHNSLFHLYSVSIKLEEKKKISK